MCSVQEGEVLVPDSKESSVSQKCMKCETKAVVVIRQGDSFCRDCFEGYCVHKLRSAFGKSRLIRDGDKVVLAFSGGINSCALVHLIQEGKSERAQRKLRFIPSLVFIDEGGVTGMGQAERNKIVKAVVDKMAATGLNFHVYALEQVFETGNIVAEQATGDTSLETDFQGLKIDETCTSKLQALLANTKTLTAKEMIVQNLRQSLLCTIARRHGYSKILLGDTGSRLAVRLLSSIAEGKGAHLTYDTGFADNRYSDLMFIRPMREFTSKETAMYATMNNVTPIFIQNLATKASTGSSLERLTEHFVTGLQTNFPNTVNTIVRTGSKLEMASTNTSGEMNTCSICQAPLDTNVGPCSALSATIFSQNISRGKLSKAVDSSPASEGCCNKTSANQVTCDNTTSANEASCCGDGDGSCNSRKTTISIDELNNSLCYSCRIIVRDMNDISTLPTTVLETAAKMSRRNQMKESIQEFLLDE